MRTTARTTTATMLQAAAVLTAMSLAGEAGATTAQYAYRADWCRFGSWSTCAATGECATPPEVTDNGWTLDNQKLQPKANTTEVGHPIEFICPVTRVFKNGADSTANPPLNMQVGIAAFPTKNTDCTLYSLTNKGAVTQQKSFSVTAASFTDMVKTLTLTKSSADGSYSLACKLPNKKSTGQGGVLYAYRTEEKSDSTDEKWRTYSSSRCAPVGSNAATKLRYFYNKATNVGTSTREVTCPAMDIEGVTGTTPKYTATVYLNEASASGGSECRLTGRWHFDSTVKQNTPWLKTTNAGDKTLPLAILPAEFSDYSLRYQVECKLTPGSSVYSYTMGR